MAFGENLKLIRKEKGISQEELADLLDVSRQAVSKWEQGAGYPEVETLLLLSKKLDVSLDSLMAESSASENHACSKNAGTISIFSYDHKSIVPCSKILSSNQFKAKPDEPQYALFGVEGSSIWGEHSTVLGWYESEDNIKQEMKEIKQAMEKGLSSYELKHAVNVKKKGWKIKIDK